MSQGATTRHCSCSKAPLTLQPVLTPIRSGVSWAQALQRGSSGRAKQQRTAQLERFANRVALCKDVTHGHLLEGSQGQGGSRSVSRCPKNRGDRNLLHLPHHSETLVEDEQGGQGPLAGGLHGTQAANPRHARGEEGPVGTTPRERRCYSQASLRDVGREARCEGFGGDDESGDQAQTRLELQKKTLGASERDEEARGA